MATLPEAVASSDQSRGPLGLRNVACGPPRVRCRWLDFAGNVPRPQDQDPTWWVWVAAQLHDLVRDGLRRTARALGLLNGIQTSSPRFLLR